ncbi:argininosuccinate lyase [Bryocella elongata]|uniref:Argininosuccinate lyase n=1 Tax=Bryocella elongata TaxID=863522 RepID=A0A1H6B3T1_9BACT|nr:argininosuccinate lyase [Bryocella elongata]SEG55501.1 argininosuccinate lyase [Bryocella elongata]
MSDTQQPVKMWSGRFREPLDRTFEQWQRSFPFDWRLLAQEVAASAAHARAIAAAGVLTPEELVHMLAGLTRVGERVLNWSNRISATSGQIDYEVSDAQVGAAIVASAPQAEDIHHFVELELTKEVGGLALKLHTGRSRNEQIATDMRLFVRGAMDLTILDLIEWANALLTLAEQAGEAVMPGFTHLQRAEPVLIAHWLQAYVSMLERDLSRFADARARMNFCPLGSGAIAGATLKLDRTIAAQALGFTAPTANSMDATSDRDFMLDFAQASSTLGVHISRFAEEITLYATNEFAFIELPEAFSTGSSAMPQKKNPDLTELARGKSARLLGASTALSTLVKGLPLAYNKDLQEGQEQIFDIADTLAGLLSVLPNFTRALKFKTANLRIAAETGYLNAMAAATYLSNKGVPFRKAHEIVGNAVRMGLEKGVELNALSLEDLRTLSAAFDADVFDAISLKATLDCHDVTGGTATHQVATALAAARLRISHLASGISSVEDSHD